VASAVAKSPLRSGFVGQALWRTGCRMFLKVHTRVVQCAYRGKGATLATVLITNNLSVNVNDKGFGVANYYVQASRAGIEEGKILIIQNLRRLEAQTSSGEA
jgi:hypothetical protein